MVGSPNPGAALTLVLLPVASAADVGAGFRTVANPYDAGSRGARAFARVGMGDRLAAEAGVYVRFPSDPMDSVTNLTKTLVAIAYDSNQQTTFRQPIHREELSIEALVAASPWVRPEGDGAWVYAVVGPSASRKVYDYASLSDAYRSDPTANPVVLESSPESGIVLAIAYGAGLELWFGERIGARVLAVDRLSLEVEPDYGNQGEVLETQLVSSTAVSLELLVAF